MEQRNGLGPSRSSAFLEYTAFAVIPVAARAHCKGAIQLPHRYAPKTRTAGARGWPAQSQRVSMHQHHGERQHRKDDGHTRPCVSMSRPMSVHVSIHVFSCSCSCVSESTPSLHLFPWQRGHAARARSNFPIGIHPIRGATKRSWPAQNQRVSMHQHHGEREHRKADGHTRPCVSMSRPMSVHVSIHVFSCSCSCVLEGTPSLPLLPWPAATVATGSVSGCVGSKREFFLLDHLRASPGRIAQ